MKRIPEHLRKEIFRANRKKNRLSKKLIGTTNKITDLNFSHLEVKISRNKFLDPKDNSICYDEYAYFYDSKNQKTFNVEKIKNGKLKEYYERILPFHVNENLYAKKFFGPFKTILKNLELSLKKEDLFSGFYLNKNYYYNSYYTINTQNKIDDVYFQCDNVDCELLEFLGKKCSMVIRINYETLKVTKVYVGLHDYIEKYKSHSQYYYYEPKNLNSFNEVLVRV